MLEGLRIELLDILTLRRGSELTNKGSYEKKNSKVGEDFILNCSGGEESIFLKGMTKLLKDVSIMDMARR